MKKYFVSLVMKYNDGQKLNIINYLKYNIEALSENDAFGIVYDLVKDEFPKHDLHTKIVVEATVIKPE